MHQSTTPYMSQTIWPRWTSRQFLSLPRVQTLLPVTFAYSLSSEAVVMRQLRRLKMQWRRSLRRSHKETSMGSSRSCWNGTTNALQPGEITSKGTRVSCVYYQKSTHTKKVWKLIVCPSYIYIYIYIYICVCVCENISGKVDKIDHKQRILLIFRLYSTKEFIWMKTKYQLNQLSVFGFNQFSTYILHFVGYYQRVFLHIYIYIYFIKN